MKNDAALWQRGMECGKELLAPPPRSHAEAYRHELKYLISYADKAELAVRMAPVLHLDPHAKQGGYFIRSLYFDDYWNTAYAEKDAGVLLRKKYRVRVYNCSDRSIKLERKKKFGSWIYKEAAPQPPPPVSGVLYRVCQQCPPAPGHRGLRPGTLDFRCRHRASHVRHGRPGRRGQLGHL